MKELVATNVARGGRTARSWNSETNKVELAVGSSALRFLFSLSSKGGGITDVRMAVGPDDFPTLLTAMMSADRGRAMREMSTALANEIGRQTEHDKVMARNARESVYEAAVNAYNDAPSGRDHAERLTMEVVRQLVDDLNKPGKSDSTDESIAD